jgi:hypothetical protein
MYPTLPKIELFAQVRPGWDAWGNKLGTAPGLDDDISAFLRRTPSAGIPQPDAGTAQTQNRKEITLDLVEFTYHPKRAS